MPDWKSIKLKIIRGRTLLPFPTAKVLQDHEDRIAALEAGGTTPETRDIAISVNDGTDPIEGATVTIGSKTGTTSSDGGCTIKDVTDGTISVTVSATGFTTKTETITVSEDDTSFTISLVSEEVDPVTRKITFTIDNGTNAIEGATVTIDGTSKTTGSDGGGSFDGIADGSVSVTVSATGYVTKTESITVSSSDTSFTISLVAE